MDSSLSVWSNASSSGTSTGSDGPVVVRHTPGAIHGVIGSGRRTVVDELNSSSNGGPQREHIDARLQLELAIVRRKLRATELAYKQLVSSTPLAHFSGWTALLMAASALH